MVFGLFDRSDIAYSGRVNWYLAGTKPSRKIPTHPLKTFYRKYLEKLVKIEIFQRLNSGHATDIHYDSISHDHS